MVSDWYLQDCDDCCDHRHLTTQVGQVLVYGSAATVGAAGLTGIAALIVGAVANALAAMILTKLIGYASTKVFGLIMFISVDFWLYCLIL